MTPSGVGTLGDLDGAVRSRIAPHPPPCRTPARGHTALDHTGLRSDDDKCGAVTLIQRFGSATNLNIHLHCLMLDAVYRCGAGGRPQDPCEPGRATGRAARDLSG